MKIEVTNLTKKYGNHIALNEFSCTLAEPKIYGLLGRNGAGKTTLINILAGCFLPSSGNVYIDEKIPFDHQVSTESICLINESHNFKKGLKIKEVFKIASLFYPRWDPMLAERLLKEFHLHPSLKVKALSKGMESSLGIIVGLSSRAPITIFDEPYIGMDAPSRNRFYELLLEEFEHSPRTFILSTHLIDEVSQLFEEVLIVHEGKLVLQENTDELRHASFSVIGNKLDVESFIEDKNVLYKKEFAGKVTAYLFGKNNCREEAENSRLEVQGIPIQELMIQLTSNNRGGIL